MLEIQELKKEYPGFSLCCSMTVKKGQITGLVGQNGAGKSTLFRSILGLIRPDGGKIYLMGKEAQAMTAEDKNRLGVVLSDSGFSGYLRIKDLVPILKAMYDRFDSDFFGTQLKRFGLPADKQIKECSTGMKAKLKILVAISHGADLLILDEPTSGLDVVARDEVLLMLREYMEAKEERAILISSHISSDLESLCDDLYMIHNGTIVLHEDTDVLLSEYGLLKVDAAQYETMDRRYLLAVQQMPYGYLCLTDQAAFYRENEPHLVLEKGTVDGVITAMIKGVSV